jgi:hypothetical protein
MSDREGNVNQGHFLDDFHTEIKRALPIDAEDFAALVLTSSPSLFPAIYGAQVKDLMKNLFCQSRNLFSFEHIYFAELNGKKASMVLGYGWRDRPAPSWNRPTLPSQFCQVTQAEERGYVL